MGRNFRFTILQVICTAGIVVLTILLLFKAVDWPILFVAVFGLATVLSLLYLLETVKYNQSRKNRRKRIMLLTALSIIAGVLTAWSVITVLV